MTITLPLVDSAFYRAGAEAARLGIPLTQSALCKINPSSVEYSQFIAGYDSVPVAPPPVIDTLAAIDAELPKFEAAFLDGLSGLPPPDLSRHQVPPGRYSGYVDPKAEAAFCGWLMAKGIGRPAIDQGATADAFKGAFVLADALYKAGWDDASGNDYDPRKGAEWQAVVDAIVKAEAA